MLEPDSSRVAPTQAGSPGGRLGPDALQILTTEQWSLLDESRSRASPRQAERQIERSKGELEPLFPTPR